jgi:hypothetical protein
MPGSWHYIPQFPRTLAATLDPETHQWTITAPMLTFAEGDWWEKEFKMILGYDPPSRGFKLLHQSTPFPSPIRFNRDAMRAEYALQENGWRRVRRNELGKWILGKFTTPARSDTPVSTFRLVNNFPLQVPDANYSAWEREHAGLDLSYSASELTAESAEANPPDFPGDSVIVHVDTTSRPEPLLQRTPKAYRSFTVRFSDRWARSLEVGEHPSSPPLVSCSEWGRRGGEYVVWELELMDRKIVRLAIDFVSYRSPWGFPPPSGTCGICGSVRINSSFGLAVPVPGPDPEEWVVDFTRRAAIKPH